MAISRTDRKRWRRRAAQGETVGWRWADGDEDGDGDDGDGIEVEIKFRSAACERLRARPAGQTDGQTGKTQAELAANVIT